MRTNLFLLLTLPLAFMAGCSDPENHGSDPGNVDVGDDGGDGGDDTGGTGTADDFSATLELTAPSGLDAVDFYIDGEMIGNGSVLNVELSQTGTYEVSFEGPDGEVSIYKQIDVSDADEDASIPVTWEIGGCVGNTAWITNPTAPCDSWVNGEWVDLIPNDGSYTDSNWGAQYTDIEVEITNDAIIIDGLGAGKSAPMGGGHQFYGIYQDEGWWQAGTVLDRNTIYLTDDRGYEWMLHRD